MTRLEEEIKRIRDNNDTDPFLGLSTVEQVSDEVLKKFIVKFRCAFSKNNEYENRHDSGHLDCSECWNTEIQKDKKGELLWD